MAYRLLDIKEIESLIDEKILPEFFVGQENSIHVFARLSDDEDAIYSLAVFSRPDYQAKEIELLYIEVMPEYRNRGLAKELVRIAFKTYKNLGIEKLGYELITDRKNERLALLESLGLKIVGAEKELECYRQGHFSGEQIEILLNNINKSGYTLRTDVEYDDISFKYFLPRLKDEGMVITPNNTDFANSVFAFKDGEIVAALFMKIISDGNVICRGIYMDPSMPEKMRLIPFLLAKLFADIKLNRNKDKYIFVNYRKENVRNAIETVFGRSERKMVYIKLEYR